MGKKNRNVLYDAKAGKKNRNALYDAKTSILETLPAEIKLMIVCELRKDETLRKLISAYPVFRQVKRDNNERISTAMAIHHITDLGCDPFDHHDIVEIKLPGGKKMDQAFITAFQTFHAACRHHKSSGSTRALLLPLDICKQMLRVVHASGWVIADNEVDKPLTNPSLHAIPITYFQDRGDPNIMYHEDGTQIEFQRVLVGKLHHHHHKAGIGLIFLGQWARYHRDLEATARYEMQEAVWMPECEQRRKELEEWAREEEESD